MSVCLADWLAVWLSVCLFVCLSGCLSVCLSVCLAGWLSSLSGCLAVRMSGCQAVWLSGCMAARLSVCPSFSFSVYLHPQPFMSNTCFVVEKKRKLLSVCLQGTAGDPRDDLHHDGCVRLHDPHPRPDPDASALRRLPGLNLIKLFSFVTDDEAQ
jgi:hypothetical protein